MEIEDINRENLLLNIIFDKNQQIISMKEETTKLLERIVGYEKAEQKNNLKKEV